MADLGLTFVIREDLQSTPSTSVEFRNLPLQTEEGRALRAAIEHRIDERLGWFRASQALSMKAGRFVVSKGSEPPARLAPLGQIQSLSGYETHVRIINGRLPAATRPGEPIEVAISQRAAQIAGLKPGQQFTLNEDFDTCEREIPREDRPPPPPCNPRAGVRFAFPAVLAGVVEPSNAQDSFWTRGPGGYFEPFLLVDDEGPVLPMFADSQTLLETFGGDHPGYRADMAWIVFANPGALTRTNFERARSDIQTLYKEFQPLGGFAYSPLTTTLDGFGKSARYEQVPLTILLLEIAGIALFYVVLMAAVLVERQAPEITLLRSRGATTRQVVAVYLFDGLAVGIPALLLAPLLAAACTAALGWTPAFENVSGGSLLPVTIPLLSFGMAGIGVALSLLALVAPVLVVSRRSAVAQRRSEARPSVSIIQRYYLDLALAAVAALLLWELGERGSVFTPSATGGVSSDPLLLASPALLIAAAAALMLRFYPLVLRVASRLFSATLGVTAAMGLWQVVRSPGQHTRLALLLMMAVAVGTFAASYTTTADRSYRDRAAYQAGVDWRASSAFASSLGSDGPLIDAQLLEATPGAESVSSVVRTTATLAVPGLSSTSMQALGIQPQAAAGLLWFREDFATSSLAGLMSALGTSANLPGRPLPGDPAELVVWVNVPEPRENVNLWARVRDSRNLTDFVELGPVTGGTGWHEMRGQVHRPLGPGLVAPVTLLSFLFSEPPARLSAKPLTVYFDDISVASPVGAATVVDNFEGAPAWAAFLTRALNQDQFEVVREQAHSGRASGKFVLKGGASGDSSGIYATDANIPLAVVASDSFVGATGIAPGGTGAIRLGDMIVPIVIKDTFRLFPTTQTSNGPVVLFNRDQLLSWLSFGFSSQTPALNEAWFQLKPGADRAQVAATLKPPPWSLGSVTDREKVLTSVEQNPLLSAGGGGILFLAFVAILLLVSAALLVSVWMAVQRRRTEFAVLRALGLSRLQAFRLLAFEYMLVAVAGLAAGAYLGLLVGERMLSFLDVTESGAHVEPAFVLQTDWGIVASGVAAVLGTLALALVLGSLLLARSSDARALRLE
jgi:ABC-type lipoprotein release transport system permease subunit